jgi:hypothetical protein
MLEKISTIMIQITKPSPTTKPNFSNIKNSVIDSTIKES